MGQAVLTQGAMESTWETFLKGECGNKFGKKGRNGTGEKKGVDGLGSRGWGVAGGQSALCLIPEPEVGRSPHTE